MSFSSPLLVVTIIFFTLAALTLWSMYFRAKYRREIGYRWQNRKSYGYIYFYRGRREITNLPLVKIGRTKNMKQRMSSAKTSNPFGIQLLACVRVADEIYAENFIHKKFDLFRINKKNEWFWVLPVAFFMFCVNDYELTSEISDDI